MEPIKIEINDRRKVFAVKELFSTAFPNLKLEFYAKPHTEDGPHSDKFIRNSRLTVSDCRTVDQNGMLTIEPRMTSTELKSHLQDHFGIKAEIYRWTGVSWQVVDSGNLTLEELNRLNGKTL